MALSVSETKTNRNNTFSNTVIILILDFSAQSLVVSSVSKKWRSCFLSPLNRYNQLDKDSGNRYYKRYLLINRLLQALSRIKYIPISLDYILNSIAYDEYVLNNVAMWANQMASKETIAYIFSKREDLKRKVFDSLMQNIIDSPINMKSPYHPSRIYESLREYMIEFE